MLDGKIACLEQPEYDVFPVPGKLRTSDVCKLFFTSFVDEYGDVLSFTNAGEDRLRRCRHVPSSFQQINDLRTLQNTLDASQVDDDTVLWSGSNNDCEDGVATLDYHQEAPMA